MKTLVEKQTKVSMKEMARVKSQKNIKIDKALAAFKVNTFGVSDLPALLLVNFRVDTCCTLIRRPWTLTTAATLTGRSFSILLVICPRKIEKNCCEVLTRMVMAELTSMNSESYLISELQFCQFVTFNYLLCIIFFSIKNRKFTLFVVFM